MVEEGRPNSCKLSAGLHTHAMTHAWMCMYMHAYTQTHWMHVTNYKTKTVMIVFLCKPEISVARY